MLSLFFHPVGKTNLLKSAKTWLFSYELISARFLTVPLYLKSKANYDNAYAEALIIALSKIILRKLSLKCETYVQQLLRMHQKSVVKTDDPSDYFHYCSYWQKIDW